MKCLISSAVFLFTIFGISESPVFAEPITSNTLEVGAVLSLTGMASTHGNAIKNGLEFAKHDLESDGWKISIRYEDDSTEPKQTVTAIERLVSSGTRFFVGPTWGILAVPAAPAIMRNKALSLQPCNSSDFLQGVNDRYFFTLTPPSTSQEVLTTFLKSYAGQKVAIINAISNWGELWQKLFRNAVAASGAKLEMDETFQFSEGESTIPILVSKLKSKGVTLVLSTTSKELNALTVNNLEKQRVSTVFIGPDLIDSIGAKLTSTKSPYVEGYAIVPKQKKEFIEKYKNWSGNEPAKYTDSAYDSLKALALAVKEVGTDPEKVKSYLESSLDFQGESGRIKFDSRHDVEGSVYEINKVVERTP